MGLKQHRSKELPQLGSHLVTARYQRGLSQGELAAHSGLSQAQISYFELGRRSPTLDQLVRIARSLDVPLERLIAGSNRPGGELRDIAIELRHLGLVNLWVDDPAVPGAFRRPEEVIARAVSGQEPDPRVLEAIPAILAWNRINPTLLRAYGTTVKPRVTRRLAWLADIALAIDRRGGFPGGCRKDALARFTKMIPLSTPGSDAWDSLGHPMTGTPASPIWKRWRIRYDADLTQFEQRARHLDELRRNPGGSQRKELQRRNSVARKSRGGATDNSRQARSKATAEIPSRLTSKPKSRKTSGGGGGRRDGT